MLCAYVMPFILRINLKAMYLFITFLSFNPSRLPNSNTTNSCYPTGIVSTVCMNACICLMSFHVFRIIMFKKKWSALHDIIKKCFEINTLCFFVVVDLCNSFTTDKRLIIKFKLLWFIKNAQSIPLNTHSLDYANIVHCLGGGKSFRVQKKQQACRPLPIPVRRIDRKEM
jgi:hypothetical protein